MRGDTSGQQEAFSYLSLEERVPADHPLRTIRTRAEQALKRLSPLFDAMYARDGRPSIPPERLLLAQLLIALYSVRSDRQFCESLAWNLLFRWFLGMTVDEPGFVASTFSKNRERLLEHEVAPRFFAEVHLGTLARYLRLLGFDTQYDNRSTDAELVRRSVAERRILLSRDVGLLKHKVLTHAHYVRATDPARQLEEIVRALDLGRRIKPFTRCMRCNGRLRRVTAATVAAELPARVRETTRRVARCGGCGRLYWPGTHFERLAKIVADHERP